MKNRALIGGSVLIVLIGIIVIAWAIKSNAVKVDAKQDNIIQVPSDVVESTEATTDGENTSPSVEGMQLNPLTGLYVDSIITERRPIVVMLDNQYSARPQAGLDQADVIFEILAEGLITRYMAVFYGEYPESIGPVRSARPYFVEKAAEFNPFYVHVGGSMQALSDIKKIGIADIDGLTSGAFWRLNHKKAPHNMYTSSEALSNEGKRLGFDLKTDVDFLDFYDTFTVIEGSNATEITFIYKEPVAGDAIGYYTSYKYNDEEKVYYRYTNGEPHLDETSGVHLTCTNILVQYAKTKVLDSEGRLDVDLITEGEGKYYTAGKVVNVTWKKSDTNSLTQFYDEKGQEVLLNPGVTWFQIVKLNNVETIK